MRRAPALLLLLALTACSRTEAAPLAPSASPTPAPVVTSAAPAPRATHAARRPITLAFGGDVHFEGAVRRHLADNPTTVFGDMAPVLRAADLAMVNLESAITERGDAQHKQYVFRAPAAALRALRAAGVDVATNANNHGMDYGQVGLADTLAAARRQGFPLVGSGRDEREAYAPYRVTVGGWRVAVLAASQVIDSALVKDWTAGPHHPGIASAYRVDRLLQAVRQARRTADTVVVYLHWGMEGDSCPTERQRTLARRLVDAGADVVVGSHAHVVQGAGRMGSAYVAYGLGNFVFYAHGQGPSTRTSVLTLTVAGRRVLQARRAPAVINEGWTRPLTGAAATQERARQDALRSCADLG